MVPRQADFTPGADNDQHDTRDRAGNSDKYRPGHFFQTVELVQQQHTHGHQAQHERGVAGRRALNAFDEEILENKKTDQADTEQRPEIGPCHAPVFSRQRQQHQRQQAGQQQTGNVVGLWRRILQTQLDCRRIDSPDDRRKKQGEFGQTRSFFSGLQWVAFKRNAIAVA